MNISDNNVHLCWNLYSPAFIYQLSFSLVPPGFPLAVLPSALSPLPRRSEKATFNALPSSSWPFSSSMALVAPSMLDITTKPTPRFFPVSSSHLKMTSLRYGFCWTLAPRKRNVKGIQGVSSHWRMGFEHKENWNRQASHCQDGVKGLHQLSQLLCCHLFCNVSDAESHTLVLALAFTCPAGPRACASPADGKQACTCLMYTYTYDCVYIYTYIWLYIWHHMTIHMTIHIYIYICRVCYFTYVYIYTNIRLYIYMLYHTYIYIINTYDCIIYICYDIYIYTYTVYVCVKGTGENKHFG